MERLTSWCEEIEEAFLSCEKCKKNGMTECWSQENCTQTVVDRLAEIEDILGNEYDLDRLRELIEADRDGRCVVLPCKPGHEVWIVERDEDGEPECVTGYVFLTQVKDYVIVAGFLNGSGDVDEILEDQAGQTLIEYNGDLPVFPACDCYLDKESALKAMKEREDDDRA